MYRDKIFYVSDCVLVTQSCLTVTPWTVVRQAPCDSPVKNIGVDCHTFLQRIFPMQGSNPGLLH